MPVLYYNADTKSNAAIIPAPSVNISKEFIKTSDGKKVGATYSITLDGTLIPDKGSPSSDASFYNGTDGNPSAAKFIKESIPVTSIQSSLFNKAQALRFLFSSEGQKLQILSWDSNNYGLSCFPRVNSISISEGEYNKPIAYTIELECDEVFFDEDGGSINNSVGEEDFYLAMHTGGKQHSTDNFEFGQSFNDDFEYGLRVGGKVYLSDISETWNSEPTGKQAFINTTSQTRTYTVTHQVSATGKRAFGPDGLIRESWENAKKWVHSRLTPSDAGDGLTSSSKGSADYINPGGSSSDRRIFRKEIHGFDWSKKYFGDKSPSVGDWVAYNYTRSQDVDITSGSYSTTETWLLAPYSSSSFEFTESINVNSSWDSSANKLTVTVNGTIQGWDTISSYPQATESTTAMAVEKAINRYKVLKANEGTSSNPIYIAANSAPTLNTSQYSPGSLRLKPTSTAHSISHKMGTVSFTWSFATSQNTFGLATPPVSESLKVSSSDDTDRFVEHVVPGRERGPFLQWLRSVNDETISVSAEVQFDQGISDSEIDSSIDKIITKINTYAPTASVRYLTEDRENYEHSIKKYSRNVTWTFQVSQASQNNDE
tara:strand:+ start:39851 stop:41647 length:1797 start_codon:yes stop_codon:yes gene_type:complete